MPLFGWRQRITSPHMSHLQGGDRATLEGE